MSTLNRRPRRLRVTPAMRDLVAEARVHPRQLIQPHFVLPGVNRREPIASMPGIERLSVDLLLEVVAEDLQLGIGAVLLFGLPTAKDPRGDCVADPDSPVTRAVAALKARFGADLIVMTDVCLCAYTDHGHCGLLSDEGEILNDESLPNLVKMAVAHAKAGADVVAPSDMMDGRVEAIRAGLDAEGLSHVTLMSYSVKYASAYYGPFRDAADSAPTSGDRQTHQMDARNVREALRELDLDLEEGADIVMVKPALAYLDVIRAVAERSSVPVACYNVSGEYSMVKAAAARGWIDEAKVVRETLHAFARAGADLIITYHARSALKGGWL
ncbi:porphobilinogen synthase [Myxococcota bacterium]|nr:porphobilinogen synthase [Myxococcota bacterium]MBU1431932.1 porphobilinogen synthase [Myxococcota bacterium]